MAASYPSSLWVPAHITEGATVLQASLLTDLAAEIDAIEAELGVSVHGSAGSLEQRVLMSFTDGGGLSGVYQCNAADTGERKRVRAGVTTINVDDLTLNANSAYGTLVFSPPLSATAVSVIALLDIQTLEVDSLATSGIASFVNFEQGTGTTTQFDYRVGTGTNSPPAAGTSFILHWMAIEATFSSAVDLP